MAAKIKVTLLKAKELRDALAKGGAAGVDVLQSVLRDTSLVGFRDSQRMVPHAQGTLRGSGVVKPPEIDGTRVTVELGYGGAASKYALRQHEDLSLTHPDPTNPHSDPKGQAKYLEVPVRNAAKNLGKRLAAELEKRFKS